MLVFQVTLAARYLWGRKLRTFLTTLAILFGSLVIFGMNIILPTMMQAFQSNFLAASGQVDVSISLTTGEAFSRSVLNKVKSIPGIRAISGTLSRTINIPDGYYSDSSIAALTLTGIEPKAAQSLRGYSIQDGRFLHADDSHAAVITQSMADMLSLSVGDKLKVPTAEGGLTLKIVGLLPKRTLPGNEEVLVTLEDAQKLFGQLNRINSIDLNLESTDPEERKAVQAAIQEAVGSDYTLGGLSSGGELLSSLQMGQVAFNLFGFLALFMGGFIIFNTFRTVITERRHDIGMLRSIGANRGTIIGLFLVEGLLQGVVGTFFGILLGYLMGAGLLVIMSPLMSQYLHMQFGAPVIEPSLVLVTVILGVGVTLMAGLIPAINASHVTPLEALRPSTAESGRRSMRVSAIIGAILIVVSLAFLLTANIALVSLGGLMFLIGLVLIATLLVRPIAAAFSNLIELTVAREGTAMLAQGNLTRQPTRAAITASSTMIGLAIIVGMGGMIWSMSGGFLGILQRSLGSDYLIMPPSVGVWKSNIGANQDLADRLRGISGVEVVSSMRFASSAINGSTISVLGVDPQLYPKVASLTYREGNAQTAFSELSAERTLIANGIIAAQKGLKVGDLVQLSTPTGLQEYRVVAVAGDFLNAKIATAYVSQENMKRDFRKTDDIFIQINLFSGADTAVVEERMSAILKDYPQFKLISGKTYFAENEQMFNSVFGFYYILLAVLALPSLIAMLNTLAIGVIERTREIGMLRAIGATRKQISRIVIAEALLLAAIGTAFGLVAGIYFGYVIILGLSSGGFPVEYAFPYSGLIAATVIGLLFGVLAAILPSRQASRMDIIEALRYE